MANINESKKYHFLYRTTNILTEKYYIGMHSTSNLKDGYLGSGTRLRRAIRKYGKENFQLEILEFFDSREALIRREKEVVNETLLQDPACLNLMVGGKGGFISEEQQKRRSVAANRALQEKKKDPKFLAEFKRKLAVSMAKAREEGRRQSRKGCVGWSRGKTLSDKHKKNIGKTNSEKQKGIKNSQYGTRWITDGVDSKKIPTLTAVPEGWKLGRSFKK